MDKTINTPINSPRNNDENQLLNFIKEFSERMSRHKSDADLSCDLLEMGTKTEFAQKLEGVLLNPVGAITGIKKSVDNEILSVVDKLVRLFIKKAKDDNLIAAAFKNSNTGLELRYGIILQEDSFEARNAVFGFLNFYSTLDLAEQIPVRFQFIPSQIKSRFSNTEYIA